MPGNDGLPPGWEMSIDEETGRTFYINHNTMQTSWTPPVEEPLPPGWEQQRDGEGRIFFINHNTQQTQWEDPRLSFEDAPSISYPSFDNDNAQSSGPGYDSGYYSQSMNSSYGAGGNVSSNGSGKVSCSACTFENSPSDTACSVCGTDLPKTNANSGGSSYESGARAGGSDEIDAATAAAIAAAQAEDEAYMSQTGSANEYIEVTDPRELEPFAVPDEYSMICTLCAKPFDWKNRKHHCRCSGGLYCQDCSSHKVRFAVRGEDVKERRVCDICFEHQNAGDRHCYLRYIGILRDAGGARRKDRFLAFKGVAQMVERLPNAMQPHASVEDQAMASRTLHQIERCGGAAAFCELVSPDNEREAQIESCRAVACMAEVAASSPSGSEASLSRSRLRNDLSEGSVAMSSIASMLRPDTPWEAHMHLAKAFYLLGDMSEIQLSVRKMNVIGPLCEDLLASEEQLQSWTVRAISRLIDNNADNVEAMLEANGMQALVLLLTSNDDLVKEHATAAICSGLQLEVTNPGRGGMLASRIRDAIVNLGGTSASVALLGSNNATVARSGLRLIMHLSNGQAEVVRAAGAVPLVVALLASRDSEIQASAAQLLRNIAQCSMAGSAEVLESGGLSMTIPLLGAPDSQTRSNAASLCEIFAADEQGSTNIIEAHAVPALVNLVRDSDNSVRGPAAGTLVQLLQCGSHEKQIVVNAGGVEALLGLENSSDPMVLRQLVGAVYSFVSDASLLESLSRRIAPPTMAMKLLGLLGGQHARSLDMHTIEMLLLVVAVLCGARDGDQLKTDAELAEATPTETQTRDLVASNGSQLILPLLSSSRDQPALVLAVFRLLLSVCSSMNGATAVAKAGGITAVVRALDDSLHVEASDADAGNLVTQLRQYGIALFGRLCSGGNASGGRSDTISTATADDVRYGVRAITRVLDQPNHAASDHERLAMQLSAVRALRSLSFHSGNWEAIASVALPQLIEMLLSNDSQSTLLADIASVISNLAKLEKHSDMVLDAGAVFALLGLLSEKEGEAVEAGLRTLIALAESSKRCRLAIVDQGAAPKLLHLAEQRESPIPELALKCLSTLAKEPANAPKITAETGATDSLLRLLKSPDSNVSEQAMEILLAVAKDSDTLWQQLVVNADIESAVALLKLGPPRVQGQACSTIAALCGDSPGYALCASPTILEVLPVIVQLLTPPEHFGADKSESPAKEAAAACALLSGSSVAREALVAAGVIPSLVALLLRERRLGRPRSATSEHTLRALFSLSSSAASEETSEQDSPNLSLWTGIQKLGKRRDAIDAVITILDAHIRDTTPTPSGCDRMDICEEAVVLLGRLPGALTPNEVTLIGRSARSINLVMGEVCPESLMKACLQTLGRLSKEPSLVQVLTAAGTIRTVSRLLEPLLSSEDTSQDIHVEASVTLQAAKLIASIVHDAHDRSVDDAIIGTKAIPALAALLTRTDELFPAHEHAEAALSAGLEAIASLARGGPAVQKAIMKSGDSVLPALAQVVDRFDHDGDESLPRATYAFVTLSRLATLGEHRHAIVSAKPSLTNIACRVFESTEDAKLVQAATQFVADLGPSVLDGQVVEALVCKVISNETFSNSRGPALQALGVYAMDPALGEQMLDLGILDTVIDLLQEDSTEGKPGVHVRSAATLLRLLCSLSAMRGVQPKQPHDLSKPAANRVTTVNGQDEDCEKESDMDDEATESELPSPSAPESNGDNEAAAMKNLERSVDACSAVILGEKNYPPSVVTEALLGLNMLVLTKEARERVAKLPKLLQMLKSIAISAASETFAAQTAANVVRFIGTGEVLEQERSRPRGPPPPLAAGAGPKSSPTSPPPPAPGSVSSSVSSPVLKPTNGYATKPPAQASTFASSASVASSSSSRPAPPPMMSSQSSLPRSSPLMAPRQPPSGPPPPISGSANSGTLLPTYSNTSMNSSFRRTPSSSQYTSGGGNGGRSLSSSSSTAMSDEQYAMRLQAEEDRRAREQQAKRPASTPAPAAQPKAWSCSKCTFENGSDKAKCEMCDTARPGGAGSSSNAGGGGSTSNLVRVKCPNCGTVLGAPSGAQMFQCMQCHTTSAVSAHRC